MATQAEPEAEFALNSDRPSAMQQIQDLMDSVTPEQLAGPIPGCSEVDSGCNIVGTVSDNMRRLFHARDALRAAQDTDIHEMKVLVDKLGDAAETDQRGKELLDSLDGRKVLHAIISAMLAHDFRFTFPELGKYGCPGHIFSDGSVGLHERPEVGLHLAVAMFGAGKMHIIHL